MQELIAIESQPASLTLNFDELKAHIATELERYDIIVTGDTVKDAKKLATELNQTASVLDKRRKEEVAKVSEPIKAFDDQMKEVVSMCKDGRKKILSQVEKFENETRDTVRKLLLERRSELWVELDVAPEFQRAKFDDLVLLTSITATGKLTKGAAHSLEIRVRDDLAKQEKVKWRLLELENASFRAGLSAPLTRDHVAPFLEADDERYNAELNRIIEAEIDRQEQAEKVMRERMEKEQREKEERAAQEREQQERAQAEAEAAKPENAPAAPEAQETAQPKAPDTAPSTNRSVNRTLGYGAPPKTNVGTPGHIDHGNQRPAPAPTAPPLPTKQPEAGTKSPKTLYRLTATFEVAVPSHVPPSAVQIRLGDILREAGITSLHGIDIEEVKGAQPA